MPPRRLTFREIADDIADRIEVGDYPVGSTLPSYRELAEIYSVSRATVEKSIALLRDRRLVAGMPGVAVYVMRVPSGG
jgi:GntR family transcriptional regulator